MSLYRYGISRKNRTLQQGQFLLEVVIAVAVMVLISTGLITATTTALGNNRRTEVKQQASKILQEGIELARRRKEQGWSDFVAMSGVSPIKWCLGYDYQTQFMGYVSDTCLAFGPHRFVRTIELTKISDSQIDAMVVVTWSEGPRTYSSEVSTSFYAWESPPFAP